MRGTGGSCDGAPRRGGMITGSGPGRGLSRGVPGGEPGGVPGVPGESPV